MSKLTEPNYLTLFFIHLHENSSKTTYKLVFVVFFMPLQN